MADDQAAAATPPAVAAPGAPWWGGADSPLCDQISQPRLRGMGEEILDFMSHPDPTRIDPPFGAKMFLKSSEVFSISALGLDRPTRVHLPLAVDAATRRPYLAMVATTRTNPTLVLLTGLDETASEEQPTCAWRFERPYSLAVLATLRMAWEDDGVYRDAPESMQKLCKWVCDRDAKVPLTDELFAMALNDVHVVHLGPKEAQGSLELAMNLKLQGEARARFLKCLEVVSKEDWVAPKDLVPWSSKYYQAFQMATEQCTALVSSATHWGGNPHEWEVPEVVQEPAVKGALQSACGLPLTTFPGNGPATRFPGVGYFNIEPANNADLPALVACGVSLGTALHCTSAGTTPTMVDLATLLAELRCLANLATYATDRARVALAYAGCGTYRIAEEDWERAKVWMPRYTFPGFEDRVDQKCFVDIVTLYLIKVRRGEAVLTRNDSYAKEFLRDHGHAELAKITMQDLKNWTTHCFPCVNRSPQGSLFHVPPTPEEKRSAAARHKAALVVARRFQEAIDHFNAKGTGSLRTPDQVLTHLIYAFFKPFCNWHMGIVPIVPDVDPNLFFPRPSEAPVAPPTAVFPRLDPRLGLRIAQALRRIINNAVDAQSGGWLHSRSL